MNMLTAEQVRKVLFYHLPHHEYYSIEQTDGWQAIADELNAELGIAQNSEIDEPDTIRNELEDNDYAVISHHNDEKQTKLMNKEYEFAITDELYDTREKLEDEIRSMRKRSSTEFCRSAVWIEVPIGVVLKWLDRQAAITSAEWERATDVAKAERDELKETLKNRTCKNVDRLASRGFFTCSECGIGGEHGIPNFCSNCGAKVLKSKR